MIMYYDINTKQEFIRVAKPSIVIPVGFEGYIRPDHGRHLGHRGPDQPPGPERRH